MKSRFAVASLLAAAAAYAASPADFGMAELNAAIAARNFKYKPKILAELNVDPPETFRIDPFPAGGGRISGGDLRGLMYGLLEAASQMRTLGHLKLARGSPFLTPRGVKAAADPYVVWFGSEEFWTAYLQALARDRFNRLQLVFDRFPDRDLLPALKMISQIASRYAIDLALGLKSFSPESAPQLQELLSQCGAIRSVSLTLGGDLGKQALVETLGRAGRRVVLDDGRLWQVDPFQVGPNEDSIRSAVMALTSGFEVSAPLGGQGIGLWGRLGYDPQPPKPPAPAPTRTAPANTSSQRISRH
ncbi:MAG TPA: hypothetical protein VKV74_06685 [Bryobacteraceae bacterium]|nr:hypothetical protein [Bryobacteraceae bacterium]